ncbi:23696_t:CDS:2 [Gigaspora rosea]|nr:23696_t:CDS:2 [Gigaspora rosea]
MGSRNSYYRNGIGIKRDIQKKQGQEIERRLKTVNVEPIVNSVDFGDVSQADRVELISAKYNTNQSYEPTTRTKPPTLQVMQTDVVTTFNQVSYLRFASPTNDHTLPARETVTPGVSGSSGFVNNSYFLGSN